MISQKMRSSELSGKKNHPVSWHLTNVLIFRWEGLWHWGMSYCQNDSELLLMLQKFGDDCLRLVGYPTIHNQALDIL